MASRKPKTTEVKERKVGFINESLDDIKEAAPAPEGEYDLRITKANRKDSKKGTDMIECVIVFEDGDVDAPPIFHYLLSWDENTSEEEILRRKREIKRFCAVFDVDPSDFDETDLKGQTGTCPVVQEEGDDGEVRNRLKLPRIKE